MGEARVNRIKRDLTEAEGRQLKQHQQQIAEELPDLERRHQMRKEARDEATLSGELRAGHASEVSLAEIAVRIGIDPLLLDRLAGELGYVLRKS